MEITVGKQGNQKVTITDARVSRKHCKLTEQPDGSFILEDLGSSNGTFVNGSSVVKTRVKRDTVIQLGPELKIKVADLVGPKASGSNSGNSVRQNGRSTSSTNSPITSPPEEDYTAAFKKTVVEQEDKLVDDLVYLFRECEKYADISKKTGDTEKNKAYSFDMVTNEGTNIRTQTYVLPEKDKPKADELEKKISKLLSGDNNVDVCTLLSILNKKMNK